MLVSSSNTLRIELNLHCLDSIIVLFPTHHSLLAKVNSDGGNEA